MPERAWRKGNTLVLLEGMQIDTLTMKDSVEIHLKMGNKTSTWPSDPTPRHIPRGNQNLKSHMYPIVQSVQFSCSVISDSLWPHRLQHAGFLSITNSGNLLKLMSIELVMPSNHFILCCSFSSCPQSFPDQDLFQWVSSSHQVAKVLELQLQH